MKHLTLILTAFIAIGCGSDSEISEKGAEEQPLTDGKSDSFFRPTEHGALEFGGIENAGRMTEDATFHAWTFELTDDAEFTLKTDVTKNLDTVMYLYRRDSSDESWGRFKEKNDDFEGNIWSQITFNGDAGQYRVIVKPFKAALRGSFSVTGTCEGPGCAASAVCEPDQFASLPDFGFTTGCVGRLNDVIASPVMSSNFGTYAFNEERCSVSEPIRLATDHYREWINDFFDFDELDFGNGVQVDFEHRKHAGGHDIFINAGGDEDGMSLIYDNDGNLLAVYQHNQSPTADFYCGDDSEREVDAPGVSCFGDLRRNIPHSAEDMVEKGKGSATLEEIAAANQDVLGINEVIEDFRTIFAVDAGTEVDFKTSNYDGFDGDEAVGLIELDVAGNTANYTTTETFDGLIFMRDAGEQSGIVCD